MNELTVSLVIPAHNEEKYIRACLDSVMRSGAKFKEIIVVDNASGDKTSEVAAAVPGVRVVRESQKGTGHARQRGFAEATGDVVAFIDSDVSLSSGWYETVVSEFMRDPNLVCLSGPFTYDSIPFWQQALGKVYWWCAMPFYWIIGYMAVGGNMALRRSALQKMGGFDTSIAFYGDDTNIAKRAKAIGRVKFTSKLTIRMSARRMLEQGFFKTGWLYVINFFSQVFAKKSVTREYRDIR